MENKLTWAELKKVVARQTALTEKETNLILNTWLDEMVAALKRGEDLHINGLGTFRIKTMKPRKSVDVTTGESIILPATQRLTYAMAANMENQLNGNAPTRLEVGVDPIKKLGEQADEIIDILGELGQGPKSTGKVPEPTVDTPTEESATNEPISSEETTSAPKEPSTPTPTPITSSAVSADTKPDTHSTNGNPSEGNNKGKNGQRLWLTVGITIVFFVLFVVGMVFFFQYKIEQWLNDLREKAEMIDEVPETIGSDTLPQPTFADTLAEEQPCDSDRVAQDSLPVVAPSLRPEEYTEFIGTEQMHADSRLSWMAYRYYGKKDLWVFIYDANRDHIANPNTIQVGTTIRIPKLSDELLQCSTPEVQDLIRQMENEFLKK